MRRVTSRPRLCSWDQFDASAPDTDTDTDTDGDTNSQADSDYRSCFSVTYSHAGSGNFPNNISGNGSAPGQSVRRLSQGGDGFGVFGPSRSSSMLSMKQFTAHQSFDEIDGDSDYSIEGISVSVIHSDVCGLDHTQTQIEMVNNDKDERKRETDAAISALAFEVPSLTTDTSDPQTATYAYTGRSNKRSADGIKKSVSFSTLAMATNMNMNTPQNTETDTSSYTSPTISSPLLQLQQDALIHCLSFIELNDLNELSTTCQTFWNLLIGSQSKSNNNNNGEGDISICIRNVVWWNVIRGQFPNLHLANDYDSGTLTPNNVKFVENNGNSEASINYPALLSLSQPSPSTIDLRHFKPTISIIRRIPVRPPETPASVHMIGLLARTQNLTLGRSTELSINSKPPSFRKLVVDIQKDDLKSNLNSQGPVKMEVVQFLERVGAGDRSIVSDAPLPRPTAKSYFRGKKHMMNTVGAYISKALDKQPRIRPFVSPFMSSMAATTAGGGIPVQIDLTPRMMAYFEVSILPNPEAQVSQQSSSCVAVGLSTQNFQSPGRMPGWDASSYGYHGDDGGLFHSHGEMLRVYGPKFNVGDTVGCGVNYMNGGIFFTLNGDFLGYAWLNEQIVTEGREELYPTVGVDSKDFIACNFGNESPFVFNFARFVSSGGNMPLE